MTKFTRDLSIPEHNLISNALFEQGRAYDKKSFELLTVLAKLSESDNAYEHTKAKMEEYARLSKASYNLELISRRYTLTMTTDVVIPDLS